MDFSIGSRDGTWDAEAMSWRKLLEPTAIARIL